MTSQLAARLRAMGVIAGVATIFAAAACEPVAVNSPTSSNTMSAAPTSKPALGPGLTSVPTAEISRYRTVDGLGTFAPFAGPAVARTGEVYLGNTQAELIQLSWWGNVQWRRTLPDRLPITTSPVVGARMIYVATNRVATVRDHRNGGPVVERVEAHATIHRVDPTNLYLGSTTLTELPQSGGDPNVLFGPSAIGQPSLWRWGSEEVVLVTAMYPQPNAGYDLHLYAIDTAGSIVGDWKMYVPYAASGGGGLGFLGDLWDWVTGSSEPARVPPPAKLPALAAVAVSPNSGTVPPLIAIVEPVYDQIYYFDLCTPITCAGSPRGFVARGQAAVGRQTTSAPAILQLGPGGEAYTAVGASAGVAFGGPSPNAPAYLKVGGKSNVDVFAAPSVTVGGRLVVVNAEAGLYQYLNGAEVNSFVFGGEASMARAITSSTHILISTTKAFRALKTDTNSIDFELRVEGGGVRAPVIGLGGNVYNLVGDTLYIHGRQCTTERADPCQFAPIGIDGGVLSAG